jgi:hypothetical protein
MSASMRGKTDLCLEKEFLLGGTVGLSNSAAPKHQFHTAGQANRNTQHGIYIKCIVLPLIRF